MGSCVPEWTFHKHITLDRFGQIGNVPFFLLKMFFHAWPSKTQSSKLHDYFFMQEQIDHNTIRKNCVRVLGSLFLCCVLWKGKIVRKETGERKTDYLCLFFFFEGCLLKNNNPNQAINGIYIKHFQVLKWLQPTRPL